MFAISKSLIPVFAGLFLLNIDAAFAQDVPDETPASTAPAPKARASTVSEEDNQTLITKYERGRSEYWNEANNCWNIFRHNTLRGGEQIPSARTRLNVIREANALITSGFLKITTEGTPDDMVDTARFMHAGSEGALLLSNDKGDAHIINLYMDNSRVLHVRDFGMTVDRLDQLHNSWQWTHAKLFVNITPGKNKPGNPGAYPVDTPEDQMADDQGTYSQLTKWILETVYTPAP